jgi:DNA (cytosine-5)-methyltransferase 1
MYPRRIWEVDVVDAGSMRRPLVIDLYAGAGGLSLGMEQAGFDVVAAVELDAVHAQVHRFNFPTTPVLCGDLSVIPTVRIQEAALKGAASLGVTETDFELAAVVGGPPCQGFSVGGVRQIDDERNTQLMRFVDLVVELQPKVFCLENVAGLLEARFNSLRADAMRRLADGGYVVGGFDTVVNASSFGVPQRRRRVVVLGGKGEAPEFLEPEDDDVVTVADALVGLPDLTQYHVLLSSDEVLLNDEDLTALVNASSSYARRLLGIERDELDLSHPRPTNIVRLTNSLRTVHTARSRQRFSRTSPGGVERVSRLFRLDPDGVARTLRAGTGMDRGSHTSPRPIHPEKPRVITVREAARLHGYPDWFRFHATNWHGHRQVGNSVPPPLAAAAGRALMKSLGVQVTRPTAVRELGDSDWLWQGRREALESLVREGCVPSDLDAAMVG